MTKTKKMNLKEFKEVLEAADFPFEVYGYEGILNELAILCHKSSIDYEGKGMDALTDWYNERANTIHDTLAERGYYDK